MIRENYLIRYLDVNLEYPYDDELVAKILEDLPNDFLKKILNIDYKYQIVSYIVIIIYFINIVLSYLIINKYYLNNQTTTSFITYVLFMFVKLYNVYIVSNTQKHTFYSAYLKTNVQYNDIDHKFKYINIII